MWTCITNAFLIVYDVEMSLIVYNVENSSKCNFNCRQCKNELQIYRTTLVIPCGVKTNYKCIQVYICNSFKFCTVDLHFMLLWRIVTAMFPHLWTDRLRYLDRSTSSRRIDIGTAYRLNHSFTGQPTTFEILRVVQWRQRRIRDCKRKTVARVSHFLIYPTYG